jgi:uncharacterized cupredoxin-like copper-binding protein
MKRKISYTTLCPILLNGTCGAQMLMALSRHSQATSTTNCASVSTCIKEVEISIAICDVSDVPHQLGKFLMYRHGNHLEIPVGKTVNKSEQLHN